MKDKVGGVLISAPAGKAAQENADAVTALISLGYSVAEATRAVGTLPSGQKLSLEQKVKLALQHLGGS